MAKVDLALQLAIESPGLPKEPEVRSWAEAALSEAGLDCQFFGFTFFDLDDP